MWKGGIKVDTLAEIQRFCNELFDLKTCLEGGKPQDCPAFLFFFFFAIALIDSLEPNKST